MPENSSASDPSSPPAATFNIADHLPLSLIQSEIIPPAPNPSGSNSSPSSSEPAIDWLHDFAGYAWIAYGAASLLVVSHFPDPSSESEILIGPILRQVFQLGGASSAGGVVSAVCWSPLSPSLGDLAAALDNCIWVFECSNSSFCWGQNATLVQSTNVEGIKWTTSSDGIIAGGVEVVLWKKREKSWERTWKFKPPVPHTLISSCWSIDEALATAPLCKLSSMEDSSFPTSDAYKHVYVSYGNGINPKCVQAELCHPSPISMIQWRPSTTRRSLIGKNGQPLQRLVLLTSCLDGAVRLWSEIDDGKVKRTGKDAPDHNRTVRLSFQVVAVIEVNQILRGSLGSDVYVTWAVEIDGTAGIGNDHFSETNYQYDKTGSCEWLIGVGPQFTVTFWAIHCLDDFSPVRFPRATLWKSQELVSADVERGGFVLNKVFVRRNRVFSPPNMCSLVELLPCNSVAWLQLHSEVPSPEAQERLNSISNTHNKELLSSHALGILDINSHAGNILKVVFHPCAFEVGLAASLDANGVIMFWSIASASNRTANFPSLNPSSKFSGRINFSDSYIKYTTLGWIPSVFNEDRVLAVGHAGGIDCFIIRILESEGEKIAYHRLCTIPFSSQDFDQGPTTLCSIPLPSTCNKSFMSNSFMLVAVWENSFRAYSWKLTLHHHLTGNSIDSCCDLKNTAMIFEGDFSGKRYYISVYPFSSVFPCDDTVSSFAVVQPSNNFFSSGIQEGNSADELFYRSSPYHVVTGCNDGMVKLWQSVPAILSSSSYAIWNLVGVLAAHQGPVRSVSPTASGGKVATVSSSAGRFSSTLHIWESMFIGGGEGKFMLEDTLSFDSEVVTLNWLTLGNGLSLLGVCLRNELKVYAKKRCLEVPVEGNVWVCVAVTHTCAVNHDFFWGPNATIGVVNLQYFSLFTHLSLFDNVNRKMRPAECHKDGPFICNGASAENLLAAVFFDSEIHNTENPSMRECSSQFHSRTSMNVNARGIVKENFYFGTGTGIWSFSEVAEKLGGPLPAFHPEALLWNLSAGNWRRAYVAVQHLIENLALSETSKERYCFRKDIQSISQVSLSNYLEGGHVSAKLGEKSSFQWVASPDEISSSSSQFQKGESPAFASSWAYGDTNDNAFPSSSISSEQPRDFVAVLDNLYGCAGLSNDEKIQIHTIIDILQELNNGLTASAYGSLDECGQRFWVAVRFQRMYFIKKHGRSPLGELVLSSKLIGWAFHSDCQENLFNSLLSNEPSWQEMRDIGVGFWFSNTTLLKVKMEKLARQKYLKTKDPRDCALLYVALNRIQVLAGLFKISKDEKDKPLVAFLSRNFQAEKNKAAALKNAYVLMGKHQLELAAAFFLLGGDTYSAVNVCTKNLGDEQLGLVICRLVDGYAGPLEHNLISKVILPSSISKGDFWLASLLEWILGNYSTAYLRMLGFRMNFTNKESSSGKKYFLDPSIGQHCLMLASKTNLKNAIGEREAGVFSRWAIMMIAVALGRSGLPLEALECFSSFLNGFGAADQETVLDGRPVELLNEVLKLSPHGKSSNWISSDLSKHKELHTKSDFAMNYVSQLLKEHPSWWHVDTVRFGGSTHMEPENDQYRRLINEFVDKITATLMYFQQKFNLDAIDLINEVVLFLCSNCLHFVGYHMLVTCVSRCVSSMEDCGRDGFSSYGILARLTSMAFREASIVSRYIVSSVIGCPRSASSPTKDMTATERHQGSGAWVVYQCNLLQSLWSLRASLKLFFGYSAEDFLYIPFRVLDIAEYFVYFTSAWDQINLRGLALITKPLLLRYIEGRHAPNDIVKDLNGILFEVRKIVADDLLFQSVGPFELDKEMLHEQTGDYLTKVPEEDRWLVICCLLWGQVLSFLKPLINSLMEKIEEGSSVKSAGEIGVENRDIQLHTVIFPFSKLLDVTCGHVSMYCAKQLALNLLLKGDAEFATIFLSSHDGHTDPSSSSDYSRKKFDQDVWKNETEARAFKVFWRICSDPKTIPSFFEENLKWFECFKHKSSRRWGDVYVNILNNSDGEENGQEEERMKDAGSPVACLTPNDHPFLSSGGDDTKKVVPFDCPKEIYKRSGELLEALCINSIDWHQAALATSRKGIIYFHWEDGLPGQDGSEYIWADADWPHNGWAGSESTPVPTCVYPGVGLGNRKGTHLGLGGATVGAGFSMRPAREQMNSGLPGYSGMGASSLGWGVQEDFEQFTDPTPTIGSVSTSSFSAHPSMPLFLVGSSNTHVYLWEFGKGRATATYGVLPAANVPPPYVLASISAVMFDQCGHRFVTGASDGTVCTWQLEVGCRSNVGPTESALCFDNHTSDVTYVTPSGSIIAAAGYSSTGINVVIWDTLAPNATSRASIMCHEGGTRSLSVFDNNLGSGSVSPLIVTGGKAGDVGLHDFRYIATGRTKKHKNNDISEPHGNLCTTVEMQTKTGDQNRNGMLWYIPKAHTGSVTKVCAIPNTSFFLTGSKDGDVKLWDAKRARLVFHWPRLHERHTFLQPSSRGFGGVVRAGVTDIQVFSHGFLTCGGDGTVKLIQLSCE